MNSLLWGASFNGSLYSDKKNRRDEIAYKIKERMFQQI